MEPSGTIKDAATWNNSLRTTALQQYLGPIDHAHAHSSISSLVAPASKLCLDTSARLRNRKVPKLSYYESVRNPYPDSNCACQCA